MKELLYFSFADLLVRVEYNKDANSLKYSSHREVSFGERVVIEQYLLANTALKTDYYNQHPALFVYLGIDPRLIKELNLFHLKNTLKSLVSKEKEVKETIDDLLSKSMTNYYFEQIGDEIISLRKEIEGLCRKEKISESRHKLNELIKAYNLYAGKKITLEEVVPEELRVFLEQVEKPF